MNAAPKLTLYTIIPLPILSIIIYNISKQLILKVRLYRNTYQPNLSQETFSGISVIKSVVEDQKHNVFQSLMRVEKTN